MQKNHIEKYMRDKLDNAILKQSLRDLASKNIKLRRNAKSFFMSDSFQEFCARNKFAKADEIKKGVDLVLTYPLISRKTVVNQIAKLLDTRLSKVTK
jgi:hypothetical protein